MKINRFPIIIFTLVMFACRIDANAACERKQSVDEGWLFHYGDLPYGELPTLDDAGWRTVNLPHDWSVENIPGTCSPFDSTVVNGVSSGYTKGGISWYRKHLYVDSSDAKHKFFIVFDGVYMNSAVYVNGRLAGKHYYGYDSFRYDITDFVNAGRDNVIAVRVDTRTVTSRWYSGSGIYRHVWLLQTEPVYIDDTRTIVKTRSVSGNTAALGFSTVVRNDSPNDVEAQVNVKILNNKGELVDESVHSYAVKLKQSQKVTSALQVVHPSLWSTDNPYLYTVVTCVTVNHQVEDRAENKIGIRTLCFDSDKGLLLNGKVIKLKGGCIHHDNGPLGAMAFDRAEERKIELLKSAGYNAVRIAHNPPSPYLLETCDRLGMLVVDEAFDVWRYGHFKEDYSACFDHEWRKDLKDIVMRDINHPSIVMWSIGNEIKKADTEEIAALASEMKNLVHSIDDTRPVTSAVNDVMKKYKYISVLDVAGYNYAPAKYAYGRKMCPRQLIFASESYALESYDYWRQVKKYPWVIGDFVWTAFDYIGESSIGWYGYDLRQDYYPWHLAYCGDFDICGNRRPQSYYREMLWTDDPRTYIEVEPPTPSFPSNPHKKVWSKWDWPDVVHSWNFEADDKNIPVWVYSQCDEVELLLNGVSLGRKRNTEKTMNRMCWKVAYHPGVLKAVGYDGGKAVTSSELCTTGKAVGVKLTADRHTMKANGEDLSYIKVELTDSLGRVVPDACDAVTVNVDGEGILQALGNANPRSIESFTDVRRTAWRGRCLAIVRSTKNAGVITVGVSCGNMKQSKIVIHTVKDDTRDK
jgi:beta-galactosidase